MVTYKRLPTSPVIGPILQEGKMPTPHTTPILKRRPEINLQQLSKVSYTGELVIDILITQIARALIRTIHIRL